MIGRLIEGFDETKLKEMEQAMAVGVM